VKWTEKVLLHGSYCYQILNCSQVPYIFLEEKLPILFSTTAENEPSATLFSVRLISRGSPCLYDKVNQFFGGLQRQSTATAKLPL